MRHFRLLILVCLLSIYSGFAVGAVPCVPPEYLLDLPRDTRYRDGAWSVSLKGGIIPTWFLTRSKSLFFAQPSAISLSPVKKRLNKFHRQWGMPWVVGGELTYVTCGRIEFFAEGEYCRAFSKRFDKGLSALGGEYDVKMTNYLQIAGYGGVRFYSSSFWCCKFTAFTGAKLGILYRRHATGNWCLTTSDGSRGSNSLSYKKGYVPSCGLQTGINYEATSCFSLVFKCEALLTGCWETDDIPISSPGPYIVLGTTGPVLSFPVTLGLRCNF